MTYQILKYYKIDYTFGAMAGPEVLFPYYYLQFMTPLPLPVLNIIQALLLISAICIALGLFYRYAISFFCIGFTYFSFIDKTLYNNHLYLIALLAFVMIFMEADRKYSVRWFSKEKAADDQLPAWNQYMLMFLISLPYFFGGIAKLHYNWLGTDLTEIIVRSANLNNLQSTFSEAFLINLFTYGGLVYDLSVVFLLLFRKTRFLGVIAVLIFNLTNNSILFGDIGLFPMFMIFSTVLFFDAERVGRFMEDVFGKRKQATAPVKSKSGKKNHKKAVQREAPETIAAPPSVTGKSHSLATGLILLFVVAQLVLPFRYMLFNDNPEWYSAGSRFAWRMKMQHKKPTEAKMYIKDRQSGQINDIDYLSFLTTNQQDHLFDDPYQFIHLAKYLSKQVEARTALVDPIITAEIKVEFNGLPAQDMIDSSIDLTRLTENPFADNFWIVPLQAD